MPGLYAEPLPRRTRTRRRRGEPGRASRVLAEVLGSAHTVIWCGLVVPAVGFGVMVLLMHPRKRLACIAFVGWSMAVLATLALGLLRSPRTRTFAAGSMTSATAVGVLVSIACVPSALAGASALAQRSTFGLGLLLLALTMLPLLGTGVYAHHARRARTRSAGHSVFWAGILAPIALAAASQGALNGFVRVRVERMLVASPQEALAAADGSRWLPRFIVSWQGLVDAWIAAKGRRAANPETERSNQIADVFERLTGIDLRMHYQNSVPD